MDLAKVFKSLSGSCSFRHLNKNEEMLRYMYICNDIKNTETKVDRSL